MRNAVIGIVIGLVLGIVIMGLTLSATAPKMMILEGESALRFDQTVETIQKRAEDLGWKVPKIHRLDMSVAKEGYEVLPVAVIELCQPHHAAKILQDDDARIVCSLMPCRIAVYETSDGRIIISRMNTGLVSKFFGGLVTEVMGQVSVEDEEILASLLH